MTFLVAVFLQRSYDIRYLSGQCKNALTVHSNIEATTYNLTFMSLLIVTISRVVAVDDGISVQTPNGHASRMDEVIRSAGEMWGGCR